VVPGPVTINGTVATAAWDALTPTVVPGAVTVNATVATAAWNALSITLPSPPVVPVASQGGSWLSHDPEWEQELLRSFDGETIRRVYDSLASLLALQQGVTKAQEDQLVRNTFAQAFQSWRKRASNEARRILATPVPEDFTALLDWCLKTERQTAKWLRAFRGEVREFGAPPESITTAKRKVKAAEREKLPQLQIEDYSTTAIAKRVAIGAVKIIAVRIAVGLIRKLLYALEA
jgi:hypothetical protein